MFIVLMIYAGKVNCVWRSDNYFYTEMSSIWQEGNKNFNSGVMDKAKDEKKKVFSFHCHVYNDYRIDSDFRLS
jgi:hypothetical protein